MKAIGNFIKATLLGGLLVVVPLYFTVILVAKAAQGIIALLTPVTAMLPEELQGLRQLLAILILVGACFFLGLVGRTRLGKRAIASFENRVLSKVPGFTVVRDVARRLSGQSYDSTFQPVLVEIEDALTPAFIVEELDDDRFVVLVPSVPTPAAGAIYVLPRERVHWVDVSVTEAVSVITRWGSGTGALVKAMR